MRLLKAPLYGDLLGDALGGRGEGMETLRATTDGRKSAFGMLHHGGGGSGEQVSLL